MTLTRLPNYLRASRKRLALSQDEVAFLMGGRGGAKISRYEAFARKPSLETAIAFEVIYGKPVSELFAGLRQKVTQGVQDRAKVLKHRVSFQGSDRRSQRRRAAITSLVAPTSGTTEKS